MMNIQALLGGLAFKLATIERQKVSLASDLWRSVVDATGQEFWFSPDAKAAVMP